MRRASSGWAEDGLSAAAYGDGPTPARSVSCSPGADGALTPRSAMWLKEVAWESAGTMRRDLVK